MIEKIWNWIIKVAGVDGVLHFAVCYVIVVTIGLLDWIAGVFIAVGLAIFKECIDWQKHKGEPDYWKHIAHDLLFDALGIVLGILMCLLLR